MGKGRKSVTHNKNDRSQYRDLSDSVEKNVPFCEDQRGDAELIAIAASKNRADEHSKHNLIPNNSSLKDVTLSVKNSNHVDGSLLIQGDDSKRDFIRQQQLKTYHELLQFQSQKPMSLREWILVDKRGMSWVFMCMLIGAIFGFILGAASPSSNKGVALISIDFFLLDHTKKQALGNYIRMSKAYQIITMKISLKQFIMDEYVDSALDRFSEWSTRVEREIEQDDYLNNIGHQRIFAVLREAVMREPGGFVHPDLGFLTPAPCGAARGVGMVRNSYHLCQTYCFPGSIDEKLSALQNETDILPLNESLHSASTPYKQEEVMVIVPLGYQMTRKVALETLLPLLSKAVESSSSVEAKIARMQEMDDSMLLALLLAHERGVGRYSRWMPYIATLPRHPMCGYHRESRIPMLDTMRAYKREYGVDVSGWPEILVRATLYADEIVSKLNREYGKYIKSPSRVSTLNNIRWSLCQVASRATAGSSQYGSLRMIPMVDLINHDAHAAATYELNGTEIRKDPNLVNMSVSEKLESLLSDKASLGGSFVVNSIRHGLRKPLKVMQELLINYNVPHYTPVDWFVSMGFLPPERWNAWVPMDPGLPRILSLQHKYHYKNRKRKDDDVPNVNRNPQVDDRLNMRDTSIQNQIRNFE